METSNVVTALAALAQTSRLGLFRALVQAGPNGLSAGQLSEQMGLAPSSVTFHMKELLHAGLVTSRSEGRFVIYSPQFQTMNAVLTYLTDNCCAGEPCASSCAPTCSPKATEQGRPSSTPKEPS